MNIFALLSFLINLIFLQVRTKFRSSVPSRTYIAVAQSCFPCEEQRMAAEWSLGKT